jgi:hypothetical protein
MGTFKLPFIVLVRMDTKRLPFFSSPQRELFSMFRFDLKFK